jgi:hypothetical protein
VAHLKAAYKMVHPIGPPKTPEKYLRGNMAGRLLVLTPFLFMLTSCQQEQLSLPVTHAASTQEARSEIQRPPAEPVDQLSPIENCYAYILLRPRDQRAVAVQARLKKADLMRAAFGTRTVTVDLLGDHANILSLQFPVLWPYQASYLNRIRSVVEDYFSTPDVQDYICSAGFAEVRLAVRGINDRRLHPIWTARVTSEGLVKDGQVEEASVR